MMLGALPFGFTTHDLSGKFILNRILSDDTDRILQLQGLRWLARTAISMACITFEIKHQKDDDGVEHLVLDEYAINGGITATKEYRTLSWSAAEHDDIVFGPMIIKSRRCQAEEIKEDFLTMGWTDETYEHGLIQALITSNTEKSGLGWMANEAWGVEEINREKRFTRRVLFTGPKGQVIKARMVYDHTF